MAINGRIDDIGHATSQRSRRTAWVFLFAALLVCCGAFSPILSADDLSHGACVEAAESPSPDFAELADETAAELTPAEEAALAADEEAAAFDAATRADTPHEPEPTLAAIAADNAGLREAVDIETDELWFVSSRRARITPDGPTGYDVWCYDGAGNWQSSTLAEFLAADTRIPTCFHVHGNRVSLAAANAGGWSFYTVFTSACCKQRPPIRWVIFAWPSDRLNCGARKDVQIKAVRAECYGYYLAWLVDQLPAEASVSMLGYSFGTRVIGSSLHILGGGTLRGRTLTARKVESRAVRTVLLASALDNDHFLPGRAMQQAPSQIDRLLVARNQHDPAMKWYALLYEITFRPRRGQQSLGYTGLIGLACLPELRDRVENRDLTCTAGREHDTHGCHYLAPGFVERMRQYVYYEPLDVAE